jgi:hypothetical protein
MGMKRGLAFLALAALLLAAFPAAAQQRAAWYSPDARAAALGGHHVALADSWDVLLANPAGLGSAPSGLALPGLSLRLSGPIFDVIGMAIEGGTGNILSGVGNLFDPEGRLYAAADLGGPLSFAFVAKGFGMGFFQRTRAVVNAASLAKVSVDAIEDIGLSAGYGYKFDLGRGLGIEVGLAAKGFTSGRMGLNTDIIGLAGLVENISSLLDDTPFGNDLGFSLDAGLRFSAWNGRFALGVAGLDTFGMAWNSSYPSANAFIGSIFVPPQPPEASILPCDLSVGILVDPALGVLGRYVTNLRLMLDYSDILSLAEPIPPNPILLASAGLELTLHDILHVRAGIGQGLFAAGFGADLTLFNVDMAMFGRELGRQPGDRPVYNLIIDFGFEVF